MLSISTIKDMLGMVKKINRKIDKIQEIIDKQGQFGFYLIDDDDNVKLVNKNHKYTEGELEFYNKIYGKKQYIGNYVYIVNLVIDRKYIEKPHPLVGGPVSFKIKQYYIGKNYKLKYKTGYKNGAVWYTNEDIKDGLFHFTDIKQIIKIIHDNNVNIINIGKVRAVKILMEDFE